MSNIIALLSLIALSMLNGLGTFWYVYGIWPQSWKMFIFFSFTATVLGMLLTQVLKESRS